MVIRVQKWVIFHTTGSSLDKSPVEGVEGANDANRKAIPLFAPCWNSEGMMTKVVEEDPN